MKSRLDQILVNFGMVPSRTKAEELIESGKVEVLKSGEWKVQVRPGAKYELRPDEVRLIDDRLLKYVSRAGLKLESALHRLGINVRGKRCLDLGTSTGGFADCLLRHGATKVVGVDVAADELHPNLRDEPKLKMLTQLNAKDIPSHPAVADGEFDLVTADLSFISIEKIIPVLGALPKPPTRWLLLIKPQFEVGRENLDKRGLVRVDFDVAPILKRLSDLATTCDYIVKDLALCEVAGRDGNQEYFLYAVKKVDS